jgi:hypothetical protein
LFEDFDDDLNEVFGQVKVAKMSPDARRLLHDFWAKAKRRGSRDQEEHLLLQMHLLLQIREKDKILERERGNKQASVERQASDILQEKDTDKEIKALEALWESSPDVSDAFRPPKKR